MNCQQNGTVCSKACEAHANGSVATPARSLSVNEARDKERA